MNLQELEKNVREGKNVYSLEMQKGKTQLERNLVALRQAVLKGRKEISHSGLDASSKSRMESAFNQSVEKQASELINAERERVTKQLETIQQAARVKERIERQDRERDAARLQRRLDAMSEKEVREMVMPALSGQPDLTPEQFDVLSATIKNVDTSLHSQLRDAGKKHHYDPENSWKRTEAAREVLPWANVLQQADGSWVPYHHEGQPSLVSLGDYLQGATDDK